MKRAIVLAVCMAATTLTACNKKPMASKFDAINVGMSQGEVERLLGKGEKQDVGGVSISGSGIAGGASGSGNQVTYVWHDGSKEISVTFQGGKVVNKGKAGF